jgi:uncharacterized protein (DUF1800 family)
MPRTPSLLLLAAVAACTESPPERDGEVDLRAPSSRPTQVDPAEVADDGVAALAQTAASRLLDQATFGARPANGVVPPPIDSVEHVMTRTVAAAVVDLLNAPAGSFAPTPPRPAGSCDGTFDPKTDLGAQFFVAALTAPDQLRLRTAYALHQILVVSEGGIRENRDTCTSEKRDGMRRYLNVLRSRAFGSYRKLLEAVTVEPAMGAFLNMANNVAFAPDGSPITPNENFARELLQLFTIGTTLLDEGGQPLLDASGQPRPAYTEARVQAFARTLTGWTYRASTGCPTVGGKNVATYDGPMIPCAVNHDSREAQLLTYPGVVNGGRTTRGESPQVHLTEALDNLFYHPNLPPFVVKQLIGHLVTSNPSPAYVRRVVAVFKDDGSAAHNRGNLREVIRAILTDPEAQARPGPTGGRVRSPVEMISFLFRTMGTTLSTDPAKNPGGKLNAYSGSMGQSIPRPPSVFSYYAPETPLPGENPNDLVGPVFDVLDTGTISVRANFVHDTLLGTALTEAGLRYDLATIPDQPAALIAWIEARWLHGAMSPELRATLTSALADTRSGSTLRKKQLALYLAAISPEFQTQR